MPGRLLIGTAPDSWGMWFADDPQRTPWQRFLDEVVAAGYTRIELGPYGYLPTDPTALATELDARGLTVSAGIVGPSVRTADAFDASWPVVAAVAALAAATGAEHLVVLPEAWGDAASRPSASLRCRRSCRRSERSPSGPGLTCLPWSSRTCTRAWPTHPADRHPHSRLSEVLRSTVLTPRNQ